MPIALGIGNCRCRACGVMFTPHHSGAGLYCSYECSGADRTLPAIVRFMNKVMPVTECGCWIWLGAINHAGYGTFYDGVKFFRAHKFSYEYHVGPVPAGLILRHRCDVRPCVNPDHLMVGTQRDNIYDAISRGRLKWDHLR